MMKMRWPRLLTVEPGEYDNGKFRLLGAMAAWLPFVFLIVIMPSQLYLSNVVEFEYKKELLYPYITTSLVILGALILIGHFKSPWLQKLLDGLFFTGILAVLSGSFIPLDWGLMDGDSALRESWQWGNVQVVIWLALFACWCYLPSASFRVGGTIFVVALVGWQLSMTPQILSSVPDEVTKSKAEQDVSDTKYELSAAQQELSNVYHIVFDAYAGAIFEPMAKKVGLIEDLDGFTFFPNNMSNYQVTDASGPSYLTGKIYKSGSFKTFQLDAKTKGLSETLYHAGYKIAAYTPNRIRFWAHKRASQIVASSDSVRGDTEKNFALISAVRAAPELLRKEVQRRVGRILWEGHSRNSYYKRLSVPLMEQFLADEVNRPARGQYIYVHILVPHGPYVWSGDCTREDQSEYVKQAECATRLMKRFVEKLKGLGRYDDSLIVLHSDHGIGLNIGSDSSIDRMSVEVKAKLADSGGYHSPEQFERRLNSLMLIKPPNQASRPLAVSPLITQLVDIPATVADILGIPSAKNDGKPIFSDYQEREVPVYSGFHRRSKSGKSIVLGRNVKKTKFDHLSYSREKGWRILPDIEAFHEGW